MDYSQLRAKIIQVLDGELGVYTFVNKVSVPAIAIASNRPYPQPGTLVSGLEVIVYPRISTDTQFMLGSTLLNHETRLVLNQWDLDKDTIAAHDLLVANLSMMLKRSGPRLLANASQQTIESQSFYLNESSVIKWSR
jgi:hypothetical protein